jgi:hypothetical protein
MNGIWSHRGCDRMVVGFTTTVPITTKVVSSNPDHGEVYIYIYIYLIQHYVIKIVSATGQWFSPGTPVSSTNKTEVIGTVVVNPTTIRSQPR